MILIPVAVYGTFAHDWILTVMVWTLATIGMREFYSISRRGEKSRNPSEVIGYAGLSLVFVTVRSDFLPFPINRAEILVGLMAAIVIIALSAEFFYRVHEPVKNTGQTILGLVYLSLLAFVIMIRINDDGVTTPVWLPQLSTDGLRVMHLLLIVWATDIFAFTFGWIYGRTALQPDLSPKKTWEGSTGGLLGAIVIAGISGCWFQFPLFQSIALGAIVSIVAQLGDLAESALKREFGVKDSGDIIPGHGGILDRLDSLIFAAPVYFALLLIPT